MSRPDYRLSGESMPHHLAIDRVALALAEEALLDATIELRQFCPLGYPLHDTSIAASSFRFRSALDDHLEQTAATLVKETMKETIAVLTRERQMEHLASTVARDILELASSELVQDAKERDAAIARVRKTVSTYSLDAYYLDDAVDDEEAEAAEEEEEEKSTKPFDSAHPSRDLTALSRKRQTLDLMAANTPATREHLDGLLAILAQVRAQTQSNTAAAGQDEKTISPHGDSIERPREERRRGSGDTFGPQDADPPLARHASAKSFSVTLETISEQSVAPSSSALPMLPSVMALPPLPPLFPPTQRSGLLWSMPNASDPSPLISSPLADPDMTQRPPRPDSTSSDDDDELLGRPPVRRKTEKAFQTLGISRKAMMTLGIQNEVLAPGGTLERKRGSVLTRGASAQGFIESAAFSANRTSQSSSLNSIPRSPLSSGSILELERIPSVTSSQSSAPTSSTVSTLRRKSLHIANSLPSFASSSANPTTKHTSQQTLYAGMLQTSKQSSKSFFRSWKRRYCVLTRGFLYLYTSAPPPATSSFTPPDDSDRKPSDVLYVGVGTEFKVIQEGNGKRCVFGFSFRSGASKILYFSCEDIAWKEVVESLILEQSQPRLTLHRSSMSPVLALSPTLSDSSSTGEPRIRSPVQVVIGTPEGSPAKAPSSRGDSGISMRSNDNTPPSGPLPTLPRDCPPTHRNSSVPARWSQFPHSSATSPPPTPPPTQSLPRPPMPTSPLPDVPHHNLSRSPPPPLAPNLPLPPLPLNVLTRLSMQTDYFAARNSLYRSPSQTSWASTSSATSPPNIACPPPNYRRHEINPAWRSSIALTTPPIINSAISQLDTLLEEKEDNWRNSTLA